MHTITSFIFAGRAPTRDHTGECHQDGRGGDRWSQRSFGRQIELSAAELPAFSLVLVAFSHKKFCLCQCRIYILYIYIYCIYILEEYFARGILKFMTSTKKSTSGFPLSWPRPPNKRRLRRTPRVGAGGVFLPSTRAVLPKMGTQQDLASGKLK